jgi:hyperosmotically inducible periplasmic protein
MESIESKRKFLETFLSAVLSLVLMAGLLALLIITGFLFASDTDGRILSAAQQSDVFTTYLKGDDIRIDSREGTVTLQGTVAEESHAVLAAQAVAGLPGVRSVENRLQVMSGDAATSPRTSRVWSRGRW